MGAPGSAKGGDIGRTVPVAHSIGKRVLAGVDLEPVYLSSRNSEELPISSSGSSDATFTSASEITISSKENGGPKTGDPKFVTDGNGKGAAGKGDSDGVGNGAGQGKVKDGGTKSWYLSLDRAGVWFDTDQDGIRDTDENSATLTGPTTGYYTVNGVNMAADNVTLRIVDLKVATPLDLTGFGTGDKVVWDAKTNLGDWYGFSATALFNYSTKPVFNTPTVFGITNPKTYQTFANKQFTVRVRTNARNGPLGADTISLNNAAYGYVAGTKLSGFFSAFAAGNLKDPDFGAKVTAIGNAIAPSASTYRSTSKAIAKGLGSSYTVEFIAAVF